MSSEPTKTPVLPVEGQKNILITSALPYVNNVPHLGNIIGCVLSADGYARYCRARGYNTLYIGGTDEYGTATENKAREEGVSPQEICDKYHAIHREVYDWFGISFDHFGRTTTPQQTQISQEIFGKLHAKGLFSEKNVDQLFCTQCNSSLADRFVEGECPLCGADGARGDQCDACSGLLNAIDLKNPRCKVAHSPREPLIIKTSKHLFFDLDKIQPSFEQWFETSSREGTWTPNSLAVTSAWLKKGLQPRCVTRDLKWGVPVPIEGFEDKVFYVWFDAPIGYISITACYTDEWRQWWHNPKNVELHQFIGKDNIPFHCIIFPASLTETEDNYTVLNHMSATEYLNYEGTKFSKSKGIGIFGNHCRETTIPADVWRYYLFSNRPEANDSNFAWDDLEAKSNSELLANLGNLYARVTKFVYAHFDRKVPEGSPERFEDTDREFIAEVNTFIKEYIEDMEKAKLKDGLKTVMKISQAANGYLQRAKAWELIKSNKERCGVIMYLVLNFFRTLSALFEPFLPFTAQKANIILNLDSAPKIVETIEFVLAPGHPLNEPVLLIPKLDPKYLKELAARFSGNDGSSSSSSSSAAAADDPHSPLDIRVGVIESVEAHTESDTLFLLKVNVGEATPKDVVAGLRAHYTKEELEGRSVALLCNLKEATIRGSVSQGMCLAAEDRKTKKVRLLSPPAAAPGTPIVTQGLKVVIPPAPLDLKLDFQKLTLKTVEDAGVVKPAFFHKKTKGSHAFQTPDGAFVTVDGVSAGSKVK